MHTLIDDSYDISNTKIQEEKINQKELILKALTEKNLLSSMKLLSHFYVSNKKKVTDKTSLELSSQVPGSIIKDICRSFGIDGVPNIPIIRRFNNGELSRHLDKVGQRKL